MANKRKRKRVNRKQNTNPKRQDSSKAKMPEKEQAEILKRSAAHKPVIAGNANFRPPNTQGLRRGNR